MKFKADDLNLDDIFFERMRAAMLRWREDNQSAQQATETKNAPGLQPDGAGQNDHINYSAPAA